MKLNLLLMFGALCRGNILERGYLPPSAAKIAGGSPGAIDVPLETPFDTPKSNLPSKYIQEISRHSDRIKYVRPSSFDFNVLPKNSQNVLKTTTSHPLEITRCDGCKEGHQSLDLKIGGKPSHFYYSQRKMPDMVTFQNTKESNSSDSYPQLNATIFSLTTFSPKTEHKSGYNYIPAAQSLNQPISPGSGGNNFNYDHVDESGHLLSPQNIFQESNRNNNHSSLEDEILIKDRKGASKYLSPSLQHDDKDFNEAPISSSVDYDPASRTSASTSESSPPKYKSFGSQIIPSSFEGNLKHKDIDGDSNRFKPHQNSSEMESNSVILNYNNIITPEGDFSYDFDTSNGIHAAEMGNAANGVKAQGSFSYSGEDGQLYTVTYTADENGYRPKGNHLPTPPPIPEAIRRVIEQSARDKAEGKVPDQGFYDERKYGFQNYHQEPGMSKISGTKSSKLEPSHIYSSERNLSGPIRPTNNNDQMFAGQFAKNLNDSGSFQDIFSNLMVPIKPVQYEKSRVQTASTNLRKPNINHGIASSGPGGTLIQNKLNEEYREPISVNASNGRSIQVNKEKNNAHQIPVSWQYSHDHNGNKINDTISLKYLNQNSPISNNISNLYAGRDQSIKQTTSYSDVITKNYIGSFTPKSEDFQYHTSKEGTVEPVIANYKMENSDHNVQNLRKEFEKFSQDSVLGKTTTIPPSSLATTDVFENDENTMSSDKRHGMALPSGIEMVTDESFNNEEQDHYGNREFLLFSPDLKYTDALNQNRESFKGYPPKLTQINRGTIRYHNPDLTTLRSILINSYMHTSPPVQSDGQKSSAYTTTESDKPPTDSKYALEKLPSAYNRLLLQNQESVLKPTFSQQRAIQMRKTVSSKQYEGTDKYVDQKPAPVRIGNMEDFIIYTTENPFEQTIQQLSTKNIQQNNPYNSLYNNNFDKTKTVPSFSRPQQLQLNKQNRKSYEKHLGTKYQADTSRPYQNNKQTFSTRPFPNDFIQQSTIHPELYYDSTTVNEGPKATELNSYSTSLPESTVFNYESTSFPSSYIYRLPNQTLNTESINTSEKIRNFVTEYSTDHPILLEHRLIQSGHLAVDEQYDSTRGLDSRQNITENVEDFKSHLESLPDLVTKSSKVKGEEFSPSRPPSRFDPGTGYHY